MINIYQIDSNRIYTGEFVEQDEKDRIVGIVTAPIQHDNENECLLWNGFNWIVKPISYKLDIELQKLKSEASGKLQANYQNRLLLGYTDNITGISLSGDEVSFNGLQLLTQRLANKVNAGNIEGWTQSFFDKNGIPQQLPGQECIEFLDRYGDWWEGLYMLNKIKNGQINQANTEAELNIIDLDFSVEEE